MAPKSKIQTTLIRKEVWVPPEEVVTADVDSTLSQESEWSQLSESRFASQMQGQGIGQSQESKNSRSSGDSGGDDDDDDDDDDDEWRNHVPQTEAELFHRFFVLEPRHRYNQLCTDDTDVTY
jgi:hypothetical protein